MIYSLKGTLKYTDPTFVVVECGGVGIHHFLQHVHESGIETFLLFQQGVALFEGTLIANERTGSWTMIISSRKKSRA